MAKVEWADAIKTVSGALVKINKKSAHAADQKMVLATHRVAPSESTQCSNLYLRGLSSVTRSTPLGEKDLAVRLRFATVAAAVSARAKDLSKVTQDQAGFVAQKRRADTLRRRSRALPGFRGDAVHPFRIERTDDPIGVRASSEHRLRERARRDRP